MAGSGGRGKAGTATAQRSTGVVRPPGVRLRELNGARTYSFAEGNSNVSMYFSGQGDASTVSFTVNGSVSRQQQNPDGIAIASRVRSIMRADVASRPDGFRYTTTATTSDGLGRARTMLYGRAGFSIPQEAGAPQYGIVRSGRLTPDRARAEADNSRRY